MLAGNLANGVQACYRGPRLYDSDETMHLVKHWVDGFKQYRDILESDVIHGRRADGRELDWMLHVNPRLKNKGMLVVFNPLDRPVEKTIRVNLYYTGLSETARVLRAGGETEVLPLARDYTLELPIRLEPGGFTWVAIE